MPAKTKLSTPEVITKYSSPLSGFIRSRVDSFEDGQDVLQDVWYQLSRLTNLHELENIGAWLYRVARNRITDLYRKKKEDSLEEYTYEAEDGEEEIKAILLLDESADAELALFKEMFWDTLLAALDELPVEQREVFVLNELEGKTLQEIANIKQENIKTVISRKGYAVKYLRQCLQDVYNDLNN